MTVRRTPMLVARSLSAGVTAGVVAIVLYFVVVVLMPVVIGIVSSLDGGGGMIGFSFSIELGILAAIIGFGLGFGWTLLRGWAGE